MLSEREFKAVAPNVSDKMYLFRPTPGFADPPICELWQLRTQYTLVDLANFHEIIDMRESVQDKTKARAEQAVRDNRGMTRR